MSLQSFNAAGTLCLRAFMVLATVFLVVRTSGVSSEPFQQFDTLRYRAIQPFADATLPAHEATQVYGVTIQTAFRDCRWGSHWSLPRHSSNATDPLEIRFPFRGSSVVTALHNVSFDPALCAIFIYPSQLNNGPETDSVGSLNVLVRSSILYLADDPERGSPSLGSNTVHVGWIYWTAREHKWLVGSVAPQKVFVCQPKVDSTLYSYHEAKAKCKLLFFPTGYKYDTGTIGCPSSVRRDWLLSYLRRHYSAPSSTTIAGKNEWTTWIGYYGRESKWFNGVPLTYSQFAPSNPYINLPTVMGNDDLWYSANPLDKHAYCCESTGGGSIAAMASGINAVIVSDDPSPFHRTNIPTSPTSASIPTAFYTVVNLTMDYDSVQFYPFTDSNVELITATTTYAFGFTAAVNQADCFSLRWTCVAAASLLADRGIAVSHDVEKCHVFLYSVSSRAIPAADFNDIVLTLRVLTAGDGLRPQGPAGTLGANPFRLVWQYWLQGPQTMYLEKFPVVHSYICLYEPASFEEAHQRCSEWGLTNASYAPSTAGRPEGYLATLTDRYEHSLIAHMRARFNGFDTIWIGKRTGEQGWTNGDADRGYSSWARNQPQSLGGVPVILASSDDQWYSVPSGFTVDHSFCCERTAIPARGDSGAFQVTPRVSQSMEDQLRTRVPYTAGLPVQPFEAILDYVPAASQDIKVSGVTIQLDYSFCTSSRATIEWVLLQPSLPVRLVLCPKLNSNSILCSGESLLYDRCTLFMYRDDGMENEAKVFLAVMAQLQLKSTVLFEEKQELVIGWSLWSSPVYNSPVLDPHTGHEYWCNATSTKIGGVSFAEGMEICRQWGGIGYLPTVQSKAENDILLSYSRYVANNFQSALQSQPLWLGHRKASEYWLNGDAFNYSRWKPQEPTEVGPTVLDDTTLWYNVPEYGSIKGTLNYQGLCCERNSFGSHLGLAGQVRVFGPTHTISHSLSQSSTHSQSSSMSTTLELTPSVSHWTQTTTASVTRPTATVTWSEELTQSLPLTETPELSETTTLHATKTVMPIELPPPEMSLLRAGSVEAEVIRHVDKDCNDESKEEMRKVTVELKYSQFRHTLLSPHDVAQMVILTPRRQSMYGFSALKSQMITESSFQLSRHQLNITFHCTEMLDVPEDEEVYVDIPRSLTFARDEDGMTAPFFPRMTITLRRGQQPAEGHVAVAVCTALATLGNPSAFKDAQVLVLFGAMKCARRESRTFYSAAQRIISPVYIPQYADEEGDHLQASWVGAFAPSYFISWAHIMILLVLLCRKWTSIDSQEVKETLVKTRFPSLSLFIVQLLHIGVIFYSSALLLREQTTTPLWQALAAWGCIYAATPTLLITYWGYKYKGLEFSRYEENELLSVPKPLRPIVPLGHWCPRAARYTCRWVVGEFQGQHFAGVEYWYGAILGLVMSYFPEGFDSCVRQHVITAVFLVVYGALIGYFRPYRSHFANVTAVLSQLLLAGVAVAGATLIYHPFGHGNDAAMVMRWFTIALCILRGLVAFIVMRLEVKLIGTRLKAMAEESKRRQRSKAILNVMGVDTEMVDLKRMQSSALLLASPLLSPKRGQQREDSPFLSRNRGRELLPPLPEGSRLIPVDEDRIASILPTNSNGRRTSRSPPNPDVHCRSSTDTGGAYRYSPPRIGSPFGGAKNGGTGTGSPGANPGTANDRRRRLQAILDDDFGQGYSPTSQQSP